VQSNTHSNLQNTLPSAMITYIKFITRTKLETLNPDFDISVTVHHIYK